MPYDTQMQEEPAADALSKGGDMHDSDMPPEKGNLFLTPDMLPAGMKPNPGDILEFKVIGQDSDGDWEVSYRAPEGKGKEDTSWEDELTEKVKAAASPRSSGEEEAM